MSSGTIATKNVRRENSPILPQLDWKGGGETQATQAANLPKLQAPISSLPPMFLLLSVVVGCCWLLLLLVVVVLVVVAFAATAILTSRQQYPTRRCHQRYPCFGNMQNRQRGQQTAKYKSPLRTLSPPLVPSPPPPSIDHPVIVQGWWEWMTIPPSSSSSGGGTIPPVIIVVMGWFGDPPPVSCTLAG